MLVAITARIASDTTAMSRSPRPIEAHGGPDDPAQRRRDDDEDPEPQEARRFERKEVRDELRRIERRPTGQGRNLRPRSSTTPIVSSPTAM